MFVKTYTNIPSIFHIPTEFTKSKTTESTLIKICKTPILCMQWIGYLPLSVSKYKNVHSCLKLNFLSLPFCAPIIWIMIIALTSYVWVTFTSTGERPNPFANEVESTSSELTGVLLSLVIIGQRCLAMISSKSTLQFWKSFYKQVDQISRSDLSGNFIIDLQSSKYSGIFIKIRTGMNRRFVYDFILILSNFLVFDVVSQGILVSKWITESRDMIGILFYSSVPLWSLICLLHPMITIWLTFPIKIYTGCLKIISEEIREIIEIQKSRKSAETIELIQQKLNHCIDNYYRVDELNKMYDEHFSRKLIFEIAFIALVLIGFFFLFYGYVHVGMVFESVSPLLQAVLFLKALFNLGSDAGNLTLESEIILGLLCKLSHHQFKDELKQKVVTIIVQIF